MSYSMWGAFAETSWWIYLAFIWLAIASWQATKPHVVNFKTFVVYPGMFLVSLFILMPFVLQLNLYKASLMLLAVLPGLVMGYLQFYFRKIKAIKNTSQFYVPGSRVVFAILVILIIVRFYYYNYAINLNLAWLHHERTSIVIVLICGFSLGMQVARSYFLYRCLKLGPFTQL